MVCVVFKICLVYSWLLSVLNVWVGKEVGVGYFNFEWDNEMV